MTAFVAFSSFEEATRAIVQMHKQTLEDRRVIVKPEPHRPIDYTISYDEEICEGRGRKFLEEPEEEGDLSDAEMDISSEEDDDDDDDGE